jgi:hypothetical protein
VQSDSIPTIAAIKSSLDEAIFRLAAATPVPIAPIVERQFYESQLLLYVLEKVRLLLFLFTSCASLRLCRKAQLGKNEGIYRELACRSGCLYIWVFAVVKEGQYPRYDKIRQEKPHP